MSRLLALVVVAVVPTCHALADGHDEITTDLLVVGGTESGWAAALQAARLGVESITIVHDGEWLGGQYTEQALACVDENKGVGKVGWGVDWHPMKRSFHRSGLFKELMDGIEAFNAEKYGSPMPGRPYHGPSTFRPVEAEAIFRAMLQPHLDAGRVRLVVNRYPVRADVDRSGERPRLTGLWFAEKPGLSNESRGANRDLTSPTNGAAPGEGDAGLLRVRARMTIDASDWGEAIQVSGAGFECGPDPHSRYDEPSAPVDLDENPPNEMNPITWAMIVEESDGETPIPEPPRFDDRNYPRATRLGLAEMRGLKWDHPNPGLGAILHWPPAGKASPRQLSVHTVRRIVDGRTSPTGRTLILLNYMNGQDYPLERLPRRVCEALERTEPGASGKNIVRMTRRQRAIVFEDAKRHALGVLYHLQNYVHDRADDRANSFRRFHLSEEFGTPDRLPPKPYIRESLRLRAMYTMREQDGRNRDGETKSAARERFAHVMYPDGLFAWQFHYDFHRTGRTYLAGEGESGPWIDYHKPNRHTQFLSDRSVFPLRSLVPEEMDGLLGAQKNVGYSSIVSAAIRLHDQCIAVGQAAGATAAVSLRTNADPRTFPYDRSRLEAVRHALLGQVEDSTPLLVWPYRDLPADHPAFVAINHLAARGAIPNDPRAVDFRPDDVANPKWRLAVVAATGTTKRGTIEPPELPAETTRGEFCRHWWAMIGDLPDRPFPRVRPDDADGDGILDRDDALLFEPNEPVRFEIEHDELPPERDGIPGEVTAGARTFNFCGAGVPAVKGFTADHGRPFTTERGFGWGRDVSGNHRRRGAMPGIPRDTFHFTRTRDSWECRVPNSRYRVTVCVGDSGHEQSTQRVVVEGITLVDDVDTPPRSFHEATTEVTVTDGRLTVDIGSGRTGSNTCLNWLRFAPVRAE